MPAPDPNLLAALADLEVTVVKLGHTADLLEGELARNASLTAQVDRLERHLEAAEERQRELHVLLLHRDREIASLIEHLGRVAAPPSAPAGTPSLPTPEPAAEAPASPASPTPTAPPSPTGGRAPRPAELHAPAMESLAAFALVRAWDGIAAAVRLARRRPRD